MHADVEGLRPEEFADAAAAAVDAACKLPTRDAAAVLAEAGLVGVTAAEADGGLGLPLAFALPVAMAAGRHGLRFALLEQVLLARALAGTPEAAALIAGERLATIAWQGSLGTGLLGPAAMADDCELALVADGHEAVLLDLSGVERLPDPALDPEMPTFWLRVERPRVLARLPADGWRQLEDEARILFGGFVVGLAEGAIARTAGHVATRVQFGRPLSAKQAVRHWLSRMQLAIEAADAAVRRTLETDEFGGRRDSRPALALALSQAAFVVEKAIHLHGGMGFTWDVPLHYALRDIRKLDAAFDGLALTSQVGQAFIDAA